MFWYSLLALGGLAQAAPQGGRGGARSTSMLRFGCSQVVIERLDPLVNPGMNPSSHMHQVVGGNAFGAHMPSEDIAPLANCTTCAFDQDFSNYWTANMYFKARNGTYRRVPQVANQFDDGDNGGVTVYYTSPGKGKTVAFKPGFRMLTGDATRRTPMGLDKNKQSCFRCYTGANFAGSMYSPCMDPVLDTESLPATPCPGGIRSNIVFPLCWDGKNLDSPNHKDHVAHPVDGPAGFSLVTPECPASHPVKIPQIMLEVMWDTRQFNKKEEWPADGSQPFVLSMGDATGHGQHGDYVFGWKDDTLQKAMDNGCYLLNCPSITQQSVAAKNKCQVPVTALKEEIDGWMKELPGGGTGE